jgi:hypothetical protein
MDPDGIPPQHHQAFQGINGNDPRSWFMSPRLQSDIPESPELNHHFLAPAQRVKHS